MSLSNISDKIEMVLLALLITSPIWCLVFFHYLPDKAMENRLFDKGIRTTAKVEFYSMEKKSGSGKLGVFNKHNVTMANYIYYDDQNNAYKGKVKFGEFRINNDSTFLVLYLKTNPREHLVIKTEGKGILGQTRW